MKNIKKFLNKRNVIIASSALVLLLAFALFNPWNNLANRALASYQSNYFADINTSYLKNIKKPTKGGNILYLKSSYIPNGGTELHAFNCITNQTSQLGLFSGMWDGMNDRRLWGVGVRFTPGYFNSKDKLSWMVESSKYGPREVSVENWFIDGNSGNKEKLANQVIQSNWRINAIADFNGDGVDDTIWRNNDPGYEGRVAVWYTLNPKNTTTDSQWLENVPDSNWRIKGAGDVDGDGKAEILWQHYKTQQVALWTYRNGRHEGIYLPNIDSNHSVIGLADCDGDGKSEVIVKSSEKNNQYIAYWKVEPRTLTSDGKVKKIIVVGDNVSEYYDKQIGTIRNF
jgi:FG-GAP-like repeat